MQDAIIRKLQNGTEFLWVNDHKCRYRPDFYPALSMEDILDAQDRLQRFAPLLERLFPETKKTNGIIESALTPIDRMKQALNDKFHANIAGALYLKQDNALAVSGSVKARGGFYEVLYYTEQLAKHHHLLQEGEEYSHLADKRCRDVFGQYTIQVGSTGNLGMSIGMMSAALGYRVIVHMSSDAKLWKKQLLRDKGVTVIEYATDYSEAVNQGRRESAKDPMSYFVDDENSKQLFLGYSVAALRLRKQMAEQNITVDAEHPLFVYIPCGIGGAPGGITFGLKQLFGEHVHCFFAEPSEAACMLLGMATGLNSDISVQDIGLSGLTDADGLAVGRPSSFVGTVMKPILSGIFSVNDATLYDYLRCLWDSEAIFVEPSACAGFQGVVNIHGNDARAYLENNAVADNMHNATHIVWSTGGDLVPEVMRKEYLALR